MRTKTLALFSTIAIITVALSRTAFAAPTAGTFTVTGDVQTTITWDEGKIRHDLGSDIQVVTYTLKGTSHTAHCVPLASLINAAHPAVNPHIKHHDLQFIVQVEGFDGYTVAFSMAELLPTIGNRKAWVALDEDGAPIKEEGGALEVIVPDDVKPARWVHGITVINVVDGAKLSPPPSK